MLTTFKCSLENRNKCGNGLGMKKKAKPALEWYVFIDTFFFRVLIYKKRTQKKSVFGDKKRPSRAAYSELRSLPSHSKSNR